MSIDALDWASGLPLTAGPYFIGLYQPSPETAGFWEGVKGRELRLKWCDACGRAFHPKRIVCTGCGNAELGWRAASGRAKVYSCSEVFRAPAPEFNASLPYWVGLVVLEEGVHLFSRLIAAPGPVAIDAPAVVDFQVLEQGKLMPVFRVGAA